MRSFLDYVLDSYERDGIEELALTKLPDFLRIRYGGTNTAKGMLGSVPEIRAAFFDVQDHLFR
jgi:type I restriction enzyme R subunit